MDTALSQPLTLISPSAGVEVDRHGWRAKCLQRLVRMSLPVPVSFALSTQAVQAIAAGQPFNLQPILELFESGTRLVGVRPSAANPDWGGPGTVLNVGINRESHERLSRDIGRTNADAIYLSFVQSYAIHIARLDPDMFAQSGEHALKDALRLYEDEMDEPFPQEPAVQLAEVLRSMARAWEGPTARLLRQAKGAPADAPLGLVVQQMKLAMGPGLCGSGSIKFVDSLTGQPRITGRFRGQRHGRAVGVGAETMYLTKDERGISLEDAAPEVFADLVRFGVAARERLCEEMQIEFIITDSEISLIDATKVERSSRAAVRIAVALANENIISPQDAVMRIEPRALSDLLHYQVDPRGPRDVLTRGIGASPGAATGRIVFSATASQASAARGEACVLVRRETLPEDIRGMHASVAVLTERGGMSSHAAVIARGLGLPCVVGASEISIDRKNRQMTVGGRSVREGDEITVDGTTGDIIFGATDMLEPALDDSFNQLLDWADASSKLIVRANADTPEDARTARKFNAQGIGLCRTEHMFFDAERLPAMREMIFANNADDRKLALDRILPMQRKDFTDLFEIMAGQPVTIRLFDPPLHEFLPHDRAGLRDLAESLDLPLSTVTRRVEALTEYNPMLGMRGVRLGIAVPQIYEMQAQAIFEAAVDSALNGKPVEPEIMIPLVSAMREVELVRNRLAAVAATVRNNRKVNFTYRLGVMVETPRAALRAGDIAAHSSFLSFGTNDLTQMTYGLSRDDAGRFMGIYVNQHVFAEDPFHLLDQEGVGELLLIGTKRAREQRPDITISLCGEHGGNPESIQFCHNAGFDYISCSSFRVPIARLAAAQAAIREKMLNSPNAAIRPDPAG